MYCFNQFISSLGKSGITGVREEGKDSNQEIIENYIYLTPEEMELHETRRGKTFYHPYAVPVITLDVLLSIADYLFPSLHNFFVWHMILCEPIEARKFGLWLACICATFFTQVSLSKD